MVRSGLSVLSRDPEINVDVLEPPLTKMLNADTQTSKWPSPWAQCSFGPVMLCSSMREDFPRCFLYIVPIRRQRLGEESIEQAAAGLIASD